MVSNNKIQNIDLSVYIILNIGDTIYKGCQNLEKRIGNTYLIKECMFYIMGANARYIWANYCRIKRVETMRQNMDVFTICPEYETEHFKIRELEAGDAEGLFSCYSDPEAARFFNGDCCGDDFYYTDKDKFRGCVEYWLSRYEAKDFVRWSVLDRKTGLLIGTMEVCPSLKYAVDGKQMGILRIDLKSEYERLPVLRELMDVLICHIYEDFEVASILMKIQKDAGERQKLIKEYQFVAAREECNISLEDYYIRYC